MYQRGDVVSVNRDSIWTYGGSKGEILYEVEDDFWAVKVGLHELLFKTKEIKHWNSNIRPGMLSEDVDIHFIGLRN